MIRFAWRQAQAQNATAAGAIAVAAIIAALASRDDSTLRLWLGVLVITVPAILGMFCGAPLVARELEEGTFRLAWTQSVTRTRWLTLRLAVGALASMALAGLLGAAAGALLRRTIPAMLTTLIAFIAARLAIWAWVRPSLLPPVSWSLPLDPASTGYGQQGFLPLLLFSRPSLEPNPPDIPNAWITALGIVDKHGRPLTASDLARTCPGLGSGRTWSWAGHVRAPQAQATRMQDCVARVGTTFHEVIT